MAIQQGKILLLAGTGALLFMSVGKNKKRKSKSSSDEDLDKDKEVDTGEVFETEPDPELEPESNGDVNKTSLISKYMDRDGKALLGSLYQIRTGDTPLAVCREALFGSREPVASPLMRQAAIDLLVRIDCGPYNQAIYGVPLSELTSGHAQIDEYWTRKGVSFNPIYSNNKERMESGKPPSGARGSSYALIWIPMINLDKLDMEGVVTTEGMYHTDTNNGLGGSTIDPPPEIISLGFEDLSSDREAGCDLPEGDFRQKIVQS